MDMKAKPYKASKLLQNSADNSTNSARTEIKGILNILYPREDERAWSVAVSSKCGEHCYQGKN